MNTNTNTNTTTPVDVLAVMGCSAELLRDAKAPMPLSANDLREARAAVAELMDAMKGMLAKHDPHGIYLTDENVNARAALARCGAAK